MAYCYFALFVPTAGRSSQFATCLNLKYIFAARVFFLGLDNRQYSNCELLAIIKRVVGDFPGFHYFKSASSWLTVARHVALRYAQLNVLSYVDDDVIITSQWFKTVHMAFMEEMVAIAGGPSITQFTHSIPPWFWSFIGTTLWKLEQ